MVRAAAPVLGALCRTWAEVLGNQLCLQFRQAPLVTRGELVASPLVLGLQEEVW